MNPLAVSVACLGLTLAALPAQGSECPGGGRAPSETVIDLDDEAVSVVIDGDRTYVLRAWCPALSIFGGYNLTVYGRSDAAPQVAQGSISFFDTFCGTRRDIRLTVDDGLAYLASSFVIHLVDVSDPAALHAKGTLVGYPAPSIAAGAGRAYVGDLAGLHVLDVANPAYPSPLGSVALSATAVSVALGGSFAYVGTADARVAVVDVSNPRAPVVVATLAVPGTPWDIEVRGSHVYVADGESGLQLLDVSRPEWPRLVGGVDTPGDAHRLAVGGARAYVADWGSAPGDGRDGLRVIDISNPTHPTLVHSISMVNSISKNVRDVSAGRGRIAVGGAAPSPYDDCIGGPCPDHGYLEVAPASVYEPPRPCPDPPASPFRSRP